MREENIDLSIIVPVYNKELYLEECIKSLLKIEGIKYEIIFVNDGSTDKSLDILKEYEKIEKIKIFTKENGGASSARNFGLKNSNGKYILFVDADDILDSEEFINFFKEGTKEELDIVCGNYNEFDDEKNLEIKKNEKMKEISNKKNLSGKEYFKMLDEKKLFNMIVCKNLYRKKFLEEENIYWTEGIIHEDEIFTYITLNRALKVKYFDRYFYFYRKNSVGSVMKTHEKKIEDYKKVSEILSKEFLGKKVPVCMRKIPIIFYTRFLKKKKVRDYELEKLILKIEGMYLYKFRKKIEFFLIGK